MANLLEIAEVAYRQLFPNPSDQEKITLEEFIASAKTEAAWQMWKLSKEEKAREGYFNIPSYLLTEVELPVVNNEVDISTLKVLRSLSDDAWLVNVGGHGCECHYMKTDINMSQLMCDDDSAGELTKTYLPLGNKIKFPKGAHKDKVTIIYANMGEKINRRIEVDDAIAKMVRDYLITIYGGKVGKEDVTNNSNPEN